MTQAMSLRKSLLASRKDRNRIAVCIIGGKNESFDLARLFTEAGYKTINFDTDQQSINHRDVIVLKSASSNHSSVQTLGKENNKHHSQTNYLIREIVASSDVIVISILPFFNTKKKPDYYPFEKYCKEIGMGLCQGSLILFENATAPGTIDDSAIRIIEAASGLKAGTDFGVAYSAIIMNKNNSFRNNSSNFVIIGGINKKSLKVATLVLDTISQEHKIKLKDIKTAEALRVFFSALKETNLALSNEFAFYCEESGIDFREIMKTARQLPIPFPFSSGLSESSLEKECYILLEDAENFNIKLRMTDLACKINNKMEKHVLHIIWNNLKECGKQIRKAKIVFFGISNNLRLIERSRSTVGSLITKLEKKGALVTVFDPSYSYKILKSFGYPTYRSFAKSVEGTDCLVFFIERNSFRKINLKKIKHSVNMPASIIDLGQVINQTKAKKEGFLYYGLGRGDRAK